MPINERIEDLTAETAAGITDEANTFLAIDKVAVKSVVATFANATNTWTSVAHGFENGDAVRTSSDDTLPAGFSATTTYFVIEKTNDTFKLSTILGGSEVDGTDDGTGNHTVQHGLSRKLPVSEFKKKSAYGEFDVFGTGTGADDALFAAAVTAANATPTTIRIHGTLKLSQTHQITNTGALRCMPGSKITFSGASAQIQIGTVGDLFNGTTPALGGVAMDALSSYSPVITGTSTLGSFSTANGLTQPVYVAVWADNEVDSPFIRDASGRESRPLELHRLSKPVRLAGGAYSTTDFQLQSGFIRDALTTNPRYQIVTMIDGYVLDRIVYDADPAAAITPEPFRIGRVANLRIVEPISLLPAPGQIGIHICWGAEVFGGEFMEKFDPDDSSLLAGEGYCIVSSLCNGLHIHGNRFGFSRHGWTNGHRFEAADTGFLRGYGVERNIVIESNRATGISELTTTPSPSSHPVFGSHTSSWGDTIRDNEFELSSYTGGTQVTVSTRSRATRITRNRFHSPSVTNIPIEVFSPDCEVSFNEVYGNGAWVLARWSSLGTGGTPGTPDGGVFRNNKCHNLRGPGVVFNAGDNHLAESNQFVNCGNASQSYGQCLLAFQLGTGHRATGNDFAKNTSNIYSMLMPGLTASDVTFDANTCDGYGEGKLGFDRTDAEAFTLERSVANKQLGLGQRYDYLDAPSGTATEGDHLYFPIDYNGDVWDGAEGTRDTVVGFLVSVDGTWVGYTRGTITVPNALINSGVSYAYVDGRALAWDSAAESYVTGATNDQMIAQVIERTASGTTIQFAALSGGAATKLDNLQFYNPLDYGAVGDGVTDDRAAFVATEAAMPATGGMLYVPSGYTFLINTSLDLDTDTSVYVERGGTIKVTSGQVLNLQGGVIAGEYQIFDADVGGVLIWHKPGTVPSPYNHLSIYQEQDSVPNPRQRVSHHNDRLCALWFKGDDIGRKCNAALFAGGNSARCYIPPGFYELEETVNMAEAKNGNNGPGDNVIVEGAGFILTNIVIKQGLSIIAFDMRNGDESVLRDIRVLEEPGVPTRVGVGCRLGGTTCIIENCWFGPLEYGILSNSGSGMIVGPNVTIEHCNYGLAILTGFEDESVGANGGTNVRQSRFSVQAYENDTFGIWIERAELVAVSGVTGGTGTFNAADKLTPGETVTINPGSKSAEVLRWNPTYGTMSLRFTGTGFNGVVNSGDTITGDVSGTQCTADANGVSGQSRGLHFDNCLIHVNGVSNVGMGVYARGYAQNLSFVGGHSYGEEGSHGFWFWNCEGVNITGYQFEGDASSAHVRVEHGDLSIVSCGFIGTLTPTAIDVHNANVRVLGNHFDTDITTPLDYDLATAGSLQCLGNTNLDNLVEDSLYVYNLNSSPTVYERGVFRWAANVLEIGTEQTGGTNRAWKLLSPGGSGSQLHSQTTGIQIGISAGQKSAFHGATPVVQATTADAASTFAANTSGISDDTATWDGYTIGQVVKALRNKGILA